MNDSSNEIERLVGVLFEGGDPVDLVTRIEQILQDEPSLAANYAASIELHAMLESACASCFAVPTKQDVHSSSGDGAIVGQDASTLSCGAEMAELWGLVDEASAEIRRAQSRFQRYRGVHLWWTGPTIAACVLLWIGWNLSNAPSVASDSPIGVLTNASGARWADHTRPILPRQLIAGQQLALSSGVAELTLTSGVVVVLRGPAEIDLVSPMHVRARSGAVRARVGETAKGFVLETPSTNIIDLGTEFGVDIDEDSGATDVVVFEGQVDLRYIDRASTSTAKKRSTSRGNDAIDAHPETRLLKSGEGLRVARDGATSRIVSIYSDAYPAIAAPAPLDARPPLIRRVTDNRRDPDSPQYYQISCGGLRDDARAYVDRFHEWNGLDETGIPNYLRGADYVQTFNSDKWEADVEISVELSAPSRLYVLFDRRLEPPEWLTKRFIDTGDVIGVDESFRTPGMAQGGIGPGVSIETVHRIWATEVPEAGVVKLGALPMQDLRVSMYGIAAIPLKVPLALQPVLQHRFARVATHLLAFENQP